MTANKSLQATATALSGFDRDMKFEHHHFIAGLAHRWLCLSSGR
jgi:hypothetical protein